MGDIVLLPGYIHESINANDKIIELHITILKTKLILTILS